MARPARGPRRVPGDRLPSSVRGHRRCWHPGRPGCSGPRGRGLVPARPGASSRPRRALDRHHEQAVHHRQAAGPTVASQQAGRLARRPLPVGSRRPQPVPSCSRASTWSGLMPSQGAAASASRPVSAASRAGRWKGRSLARAPPSDQAAATSPDSSIWNAGPRASRSSISSRSAWARSGSPVRCPANMRGNRGDPGGPGRTGGVQAAPTDRAHGLAARPRCGWPGRTGARTCSPAWTGSPGCHPS